MAFKVLLKILINIIKTLNEEGFKLYDYENPNYYISEVEYDPGEDRIFVKFEEDKDER